MRRHDGGSHSVQLYLGVAGVLRREYSDQELASIKGWRVPLVYLRAGTKDQSVLARRGDDLRIDWGYLYVAAPNEPGLIIR